MVNELIALVLISNIVITPVSSTAYFGQNYNAKNPWQIRQVISRKEMDLNTRNFNSGVNEIFRDNILLNLHYLKGDVENFTCQGDSSPAKGGIRMTCVDWEKVRNPFEFSFDLKQGEIFAFHDELLPEFKKYQNIKTGNTQFSIADGYKVLDGLPGNGVCHLATLINWTATGAGLSVTAKVNHDFYPVPGIPGEYGTSIVYLPGVETTRLQNLYVVNNFSQPVTFYFKVDKERVEFFILK